MNKYKWEDRESEVGGQVFGDGHEKVFLSYQPNEYFDNRDSGLDSTNPETAIVLIKDKKYRLSATDVFVNRCLIYRGDWRKELAELYPDIEALKAHWKEHGGHFWSDDLEDNNPTNDN